MPDLVRKTYDIKVIERRKDGGRIVINTASVDRDRDRVFPAGARIDDYLKNPVVQWAHDYYSPFATIGRTTKLEVSPEGIVAEFDLRPAANESDPQNIVRLLWEGEWIRTASIGFMPDSTKPNDVGGRDFETWALLEWSLVPVPSNQDALRLAVKGLTGERPDDIWADAALRTITDQSLTNAMRADQLKTIEEWRAKFSSTISQPTSHKNGKSPACRQAGESEDECRSRKIPEILEENPDMDMAQVVAMASRMCSEMCEGKDAGGDKSRKQTMAEHMDGAMAALNECRTHLSAMADMLPEGEGADGKGLYAKRGRVLSSKNEEKIVSARDNLNEVLAQLEEQPEQNDNANQDAAPAKDAADLASLLDADGERDLADSLHTLTDLVKGVMK